MELFRGKGRNIWQCRFTDHKGLRHQLSTYTADRGTALKLTHKIERLVEAMIRCDAVPGDLQQWLHVARPEMREKLTDWEIVNAATVGGGRPLFNDPRPHVLPPGWVDPPQAHVDDWEQELRDREVSADYSLQSAQRVRVLLSLPMASSMRYIHELNAEGIMARVRELRRVGAPPAPPMPGCKGRKRKAFSPQTCEHYLGKAREFCQWLIKKGYLQTNPTEDLSAYTREVIAANKSRPRRVLTIEEQTTLIQGTEELSHRWNMDGQERALIYRLALRTGLRAKEIRTLLVANFNFFARTLVVVAAEAKARREDVLPLAAELVELLRTHFQGKLPQAPAFTPLSPKRYCSMLRDDMTELGITFKDTLGRYADFHALRHTYGTELARVTMPATHQKLMRHADITTTTKFYTHVDQQDQALALAKLPALAEAKKQGNQNAG